MRVIFRDIIAIVSETCEDERSGTGIDNGSDIIRLDTKNKGYEG